MNFEHGQTTLENFAVRRTSLHIIMTWFLLEFLQNLANIFKLLGMLLALRLESYTPYALSTLSAL